jgi:hypothetical protein
MADVLLFPDAEELFRVVLAAKVSEVLGSTIPASTKVPATRPAEFLVVRRIGGSRRDIVTDVPVIQVEAWAETETRAARIAAVAQGLMHWLVEVGPHAVGLEDEVVGPTSFPDGSQQARYTASYAMAIRGSEIVTLA